MMRNYAAYIIEDDDAYAEYLEKCLKQYSAETGSQFAVRRYNKGESFLAAYTPPADMIFMDVELGDGFMNGIDTAKALREKDTMSLLFFVTNMPQYAPKGYDVDAIDYILKPVNYNSLKIKLQKAEKILRSRTGVPVKIRVKDGIRIVPSSDLLYIEVMGHDLVFRTYDEMISAYGTLSDREPELIAHDFARCSASCLVNLRFVRGLYGDEILVGTERKKIGRSKKKEFIARLNAYLGG
ncbi:MAG: response regulator transcription factor [Oscillospiraceae bacterium]|nr:response regulator transcription factor [Oscillospiraceae bacterium]